METRKTTKRLLEMIEDGIIKPWDAVEMCLNWMSEDDVKEMCEANDLFPESDDDDEEDEEEADELVTYKYEVGDTVLFKPEYFFETEVMGTKVLVTSAEIVDRKYYGEPCYSLGGRSGLWQEDCFVGRYED